MMTNANAAHKSQARIDAEAAVVRHIAEEKAALRYLLTNDADVNGFDVTATLRRLSNHHDVAARMGLDVPAL